MGKFQPFFCTKNLWLGGILVCSVKGHTVFKEDGIIIVRIQLQNSTINSEPILTNKASSGERDTCLFHEEPHCFPLKDGIEIWRIHLQNLSSGQILAKLNLNKVSFGE